MAHDAFERAARKRLLQARSAVLRLQLSQQLGQSLQPTWRTLDRADRGWRWLKANPLACLGAGVVLLVWRPRAVPLLATQAWGAWRLWRRVAPVAVPLLQRWFSPSQRPPMP